MMSKEKQTYQEAITELEDIVSKIETDTIPVDELAAKVKRASELITFCKSILKQTESEVNAILTDIPDEPREN